MGRQERFTGIQSVPTVHQKILSVYGHFHPEGFVTLVPVGKVRLRLARKLANSRA